MSAIHWAGMALAFSLGIGLGFTIGLIMASYWQSLASSSRPAPHADGGG